MELHLIELTTKEEMLAQYDVMLHLYTNFTYEKYDAYLTDMIPHNYKQIAVFERDVCVGLSGLWSGTKLWSGKYLEIDNFIVHPDHRKKGIGKMMTDYVDAKAKELGCTMIVLRCFYRKLQCTSFLLQSRIRSQRFSFLKNYQRRRFILRMLLLIENSFHKSSRISASPMVKITIQLSIFVPIDLFKRK